MLWKLQQVCHDLADDFRNVFRDRSIFITRMVPVQTVLRGIKKFSSHGLVCKKSFYPMPEDIKKSWCPMDIYFLKNTVIKWQKSQNEWQCDKVQSDSVRLISFHTQCHFVLLMHILAAYWNTPNNAAPPPPPLSSIQFACEINLAALYIKTKHILVGSKLLLKL